MQLGHNQNNTTLAIRTHAAQTPNVITESALVYPSIKEIRTWVVDPNVSAIMIVHNSWPASKISAKTRARVLAVPMQSVTSITIFRFAAALLECLEMHSSSANHSKVLISSHLQGRILNGCWMIVWTMITGVFISAPIESHPCNPSPCGPNSQCREINGQAVCSCLTGYVGSPPTCRPECIVDSDCNLNEACSNQKCRNPCIGTCGVGANCKVINHKPICTCRPGLTGDPFTRCYDIRECYIAN